MVEISAKQNTSLIESMFEAGAHFGYSRTKRHPSFAELLFGAKDRIDIIDLEKTGSHLQSAIDFVGGLAKEGKTVLFVGTKPEARKALEEVIVDKVQVPYVINRWIGGTLTNLPEIRKRIARLEELRDQKEKGDLEKYTKKEKLLLEREMDHLVYNFGGIVAMKQTPDALFVVDPKHEHTAVREARRKKIPIVALAGSDCNLEEVGYPIPANDSSLASIRFFVGKVAEAYKAGIKDKESKIKDENNKDSSLRATEGSAAI